MEEKLFNDLLESVKQMKAIRSGKMKPARITKLEKTKSPKPDTSLK